MKKKSTHLKIALSIVLLLSSSFLFKAFSQEMLTIKGRVTSEAEALPGVSIIVKGTTQGTITNVDGEYSIEANPTDVLVFNFIGFEKAEEAINGRTTIDIVLKEELFQLNEVIAVGYGSVKKKDLTSAISTVKGEELAKRNVADVSQALQGQLAGVQVASNGGAPGSSASITVRGISTINNNSPLYVVDDVPLDDISWLNPKDIENVQVLKDASASAIFGSRASNGVIIIETRKAKEGHTSINIDATYSIQSIAKKPDLADAREYAFIANKAAENSGLEAPYGNPETLGKGTDWWDEVTQVAPIQSYTLSLNKGTKDLKVSSGISYFNQDGIVKGGGYERLTMRLNTEYKMTDWLTVGQGINLSKDITDNGPDLIFDVQRIEPAMPVYLPDYEREGKNEYSIYQPSGRTDVSNPVARIARNFNTTDYLRTVGNLFARAEIGYGLSFETKFNFYLSTYENNNFEPDYNISPTDKRDINKVSRTHNNRTNYTWNNLIHYSKSIKQHKINVSGGYMMESYEHRTLDGSGTELPNNSENLRYLDTATSGLWAGGSDSKNTLQSILGRLNYSFKDKYILTASIRADGSSRFAEENRWGTFPAVSGAWNAKEEFFLQDINWLSQLKIRGGWGQVGNQNIENSALLTTMGNTYYITGADQQLSIGAAPNSVGNADLIWETVEDMNIGADIGLFNQRLSFTIDYFEKRAKDMLMYTTIPLYLGSWYDEPYTNVGTLETKGFEFVVNYRNKIGDDFTFNTSINLSKAESEVTKLANGSYISAGNHQRLDMLTRTEVGKTAGSFYGLVTDGIFQNETEVINHTDEFGNVIQPKAEPGDMRFKDLNGDGKINADDRTYIGNPEPDFTFGINVNMAYKAFDLSLLFNGTYGNDVLNAIMPYTHTGNGSYNSYAGLYNDAWDGEGSTNSQPRLAATENGNNNFQYSDYYVEDGSYLRLRSAQIGFNIPQNICTKIKMSKARLFVGGENLFTLTNFSGLDPDLGGSATERGIDWGNYPLPRVFMVGANITF